MTHYVMNHILFSRKGKLGLLTQVDVQTIWFIENKVKINYAHQVIDYMIEIKEKGSHLPYINPVIEILEEIRYNFEDEEFKEETSIIGTFVLPSM